MLDAGIQNASKRPIFLDKASNCLCTTDPTTGKAVWVIDQATGKPMKNKRICLDAKSGCYCAVDLATGAVSWIIDPATGKPMAGGDGSQDESVNAPSNGEGSSVGAVPASQAQEPPSNEMQRTGNSVVQSQMQPAPQSTQQGWAVMPMMAVQQPQEQSRPQDQASFEVHYHIERAPDKICGYCGATVNGDEPTCPHCSSAKFLAKCPRCGGAYEGATCPACSEADRAAREAEEAGLAKAEAEQKANNGLVWKTILTVLLPFVGGYFLINENVRKGFRTFAIIWCALMAVMMGVVPGYSVGVRIASSLLCLAPIAVYLIRNRDSLLNADNPKRKLFIAALAAVLVVAIVGDLVGAAVSPEKPAEDPSASNAAVAGSASSSPSGAGRAIPIDDVQLTPTTEYLEYSTKKTDPVTLVKCSEQSAKVTSGGNLDLSKVGVQKVEYKVTVGNESATREAEFTVRDTRAPEINLSSSKSNIDQGGDFDPQSCISSVSDPVDGPLSKADSEPEARGTKAGLEQFYDAGWYVIDGDVDYGVPGTYSLMVKASDKHGNVSTKELLVTVNEVVQEEPEPEPAPAVYTYIANKNSKVFHVPGCRDVSKMKDSNKLEYTVTRQEMLDMGYRPCQHCNP